MIARKSTIREEIRSGILLKMDDKINISFGNATFVTKPELPVMDKAAPDTDWEKKFQKIKPEKTKGKYGIFPVGILNNTPKTSQNTKA